MELLSETERQQQIDTRRIAKISGWLDWLDDATREYAEIVLSRREETASEAGADPDPSVVICRHPLSARKGGLCLLCDNTGFASKREVEGEPVDPYLVDPPRSGFAVKQDESYAAQRTAAMERLNAEIATLQRNARIRAGAEAQDDAMTSLLRRVASTRRDHPTLRKVEWALGVLRRNDPSLYRRALERDEEVLLLMSRMLAGRRLRHA